MTRRGNGEGSIYKRRDGRWEARLDLGWTSGGRQRKSLYGRTRAEVIAKLARTQRAKEDGLAALDERTTVAGFLERWLEESARPALRPNSFVTYEGLVRNHLAPALGPIRLVRLTPQDVQHLLNQKSADGLAPRTVRNMHRVLHRALEVAARWGLVRRNVSSLADGPRAPRSEERTLSVIEARRLLDIVEGERLEALYAVALATGLRQGEALGLRWSDIDLETGSLAVRRALTRVHGRLQLVEPKTPTSSRTVTLPQMAVRSLRQHRARQAEERLRAGGFWSNEHDLVFTSEGGEPLDARGVRRDFARHVASAGLGRLRFHDLRHSCASLLLAQGVPARVVMETLGHSSIAVTMNVYSHVLPELSREAARSMDAALATS